MTSMKVVLIIIYKVLIGYGVQNWFDWFSQYILPCSCWWHGHDSGVCMHLHWCSLTMKNLELRSSLAIKGLFLYLKAFLTLSQTWFLNIFNFYELKIQLIHITHAVSISFLANKWTTCFAMDIIIQSWDWLPRDRTSNGIA